VAYFFTTLVTQAAAYTLLQCSASSNRTVISVTGSCCQAMNLALGNTVPAEQAFMRRTEDTFTLQHNEAYIAVA
jgi:hypothetical protein